MSGAAAESGPPRVALVSGGTHGIGRACVGALARDGFEVVFTGRDGKAGAAVEAAVRGARFVAADVADPAQVERAVAVAAEHGGGLIAALVNNAGQTRRVRFRESSVEDWDELMRVNARSVFLMTRAAIEPLVAARGAVVTVSSIAGAVGEEELSAYAASKGALIAFTQTLAIELGREVRFNVVCPGQVGTRMMARVTGDESLRAASAARVPVGRIAAPEEIAEAVAWLASPRASFVNGEVLIADGGEIAGLRVLEGAEAQS